MTKVYGDTYNNEYLRIIANRIRGIAAAISGPGGRVVPSGTETLAVGTIIDVVGIPQYVSDVTQHAEYGITATGWYVFASLAAPEGVTVTADTTVTGAAGYVATTGADHIDLAVRFDVAAQSVLVTVDWGETTDEMVFRAVDLAVRNLDYRTTFYIYDLAPFATWAYALASETTFAANTQYYTKDEDDVYTPAEVTVGDAIPADTYYKHTKLTLEGMTRNVTYKLDTIIDCPVEVILPDVPDDGYGAWYEFQLRHKAEYSMTLTPPSTDVKAATDATPKQNAGINIIDLHYANVAGSKVWRLINTHYTYTA